MADHLTAKSYWVGFSLSFDDLDLEQPGAHAYAAIGILLLDTW